MELLNFFDFSMKKIYRCDLVHLYFGTKGSAGLYLNEIYSTLAFMNIEQKVIVSNYFPFNYGYKIFFPLSDYFTNLFFFLRLPLRAIELSLGYIGSLLILFKLRPRYLNYSLISLTRFDYYFLLLVKKLTNISIIITCHDVVPFGENESVVNSRVIILKKMFDLSDFFLVHNNYSKNILINNYLISENKIFCHIFPLMDLQILFPHLKYTDYNYDFVFIGFLRRNKGLNLLLKAWEIFITKNPTASLYIGGKLPNDSNLDLNLFNQPGITFNPKYLDDEEVFQILSSSNCVVLPYLSGTNSGILSMAIASGCNVIYSDIECFTSLNFLDNNGVFKVNSIEKLNEKLQSFLFKERSTSNTITYRNQFRSEVIDLYDKLISLYPPSGIHRNIYKSSTK